MLLTSVHFLSENSRRTVGEESVRDQGAGYWAQPTPCHIETLPANRKEGQLLQGALKSLHPFRGEMTPSMSTIYRSP